MHSESLQNKLYSYFPIHINTLLNNQNSFHIIGSCLSTFNYTYCLPTGNYYTVAVQVQVDQLTSVYKQEKCPPRRNWQERTRSVYTSRKQRFKLNPVKAS